MAKYIVHRLYTALIVLVAATLLTFLVMQLTPGDTAYTILTHTFMSSEDLVTEEDLQLITDMYELDRPLLVQYGDWLLQALRGDLGTSYVYKKPVAYLLGLKLPYTFQLGLLAFSLSLLVAIPLGFLSTRYRNRFFDHLTRLGSILCGSLPSFWLALVLVMLFSVKLQWLPVSGMKAGWKSWVLPCLTQMLGMIPSIMRITRTSMLEIMGEDYMTFAKAKGLGPTAAIRRHGIRNAMPPIITMAGLQLGGILGGTVVIETVFSWPGIGALLSSSIYAKDIPMLQGCILVITLGYILSMVAVDLVLLCVCPQMLHDGGGRG